ncbi:MAG: Na+/H+ antiporter NhaA [Gammaproteobacteria bacterium]
MPVTIIRNFLKLESSSGIILLAAAILALLCNNSPLSHWYDSLLDTNVAFHIGDFVLSKPFLHWVNDGLMAIFFLLVGLELKREFMIGQLHGISRVLLPLICAIGGIIVPAIIYLLVTHGNATEMNGWAIPTATDIAFALGVLSLCGDRVPVSLKIFLTAIAIIDDIGAILIIAIFHTSQLSWLSLGFASTIIILLALMNIIGIRKLPIYVLLGLILWLCVLKSGIHATLAGVVLAFAIPLKTDVHGFSPLCWLEDKLHPWVAYFVMPLFAFANAGLSLKGISFSTFLHPVPLGIILGLFAGKQIGVMLFAWITIKLNIAPMPKNCGWLDIYGIALLCGIGFTMSLFIGGLAFKTLDVYQKQVQLGVLTASILSGVIGYFILLADLRYQH